VRRGSGADVDPLLLTYGFGVIVEPATAIKRTVPEKIEPCHSLCACYLSGWRGRKKFHLIEVGLLQTIEDYAPPAHNAAMECHRRAMIGDQTFEGRRENLAQALPHLRHAAIHIFR